MHIDCVISTRFLQTEFGHFAVQLFPIAHSNDKCFVKLPIVLVGGVGVLVERFNSICSMYFTALFVNYL